MLARMSQAFVREPDSQAVEKLPDRPVSSHPNFVTDSGLRQIDAQLQELERAHTAAVAANDATALAGLERDLRYWKQRRGSARVITPPPNPDIVRFGVCVTLRFDDGAQHRFRIVGEDEADPPHGLVSWTSPVGAALIGRRQGDTVEVFGRPATLIQLSGTAGSD